VGTTTSPTLEQLQEHFDLDAGLACLDFINTLRGRLDPAPREYLHAYNDLVLFALAAGDLDAETAHSLDALAEAHPADAHQAYEAALRLRESLYGIFSAVAAGETPSQTDLHVLSAVLVDAATQSRIVADDGDFHLHYRNDADLARPLWSLAREGADLLLSDDRTRVRECAADDCGWIFIDTSRNRSRRWCSMTSCGNRAKVQQFRQRQRETRE
jgi:predicted RNA-binding Zn ribbon-like protein